MDGKPDGLWTAECLTRHATLRLQQRGIGRDVVAVVLLWGDTIRDVGDGSIALSVSSRQMSELRNDHVPAALIERARKVVLILGADGAIITAVNQATWFARFQRGHVRLTARERAGMAERRRRGATEVRR